MMMMMIMMMMLLFISIFWRHDRTKIKVGSNSNRTVLYTAKQDDLLQGRNCSIICLPRRFQITSIGSSLPVHSHDSLIPTIAPSWFKANINCAFVSGIGSLPY
jgi:hypothetical protein